MEIIAYKVGLSPFLLMNLHLILHNSCTATTLSCHLETSRSNRMMAAIHLGSLDALGPGRRILKKMCTGSLTAKR